MKLYIMKNINFEILKKEIIELLQQKKSLVLATASKNRVTARSVSCVYDGLKIFFFTYKTTTKFMQISENSKVALSVQNISVEGIAKIIGGLLNGENKLFIENYRKIHPGTLKKYSKGEEDQVIEVSPTLIKLFKHVDGVPMLFYLDVEKQTAYSEIFIK